MTKRKEFARRYYFPQRPGALGGVDALKRTSKAKRSVIKEWLSHQDTYTLHKPVRYNFKRRRTIVGGIDHQWQADLIDVQKLKRHNDGYSYLLTVIDVFSKYAWIRPLKNKTASSVIAAFDTIFKQGRKPSKLQTDDGTEFTNRAFQAFLKEKGVGFFTTKSETKASIAERMNRTIKDKLWRYFTRKNETRFVDVLPKLVRAYNRSYHRSIKRAPADVDISNQEDVWQTLYGQPFTKTVKRKIRIGDRVRISKTRRVFKKGYLPSWTEELFTVSRLRQTTPITYILKDDHGDELIGGFYTEEIQKVGQKEVYKIESVMKHRIGPKGERQYLVRWLGYNPSFDSWIPESALETYTD